MQCACAVAQSVASSALQDFPTFSHIFSLNGTILLTKNEKENHHIPMTLKKL
jgi:hypothetical protein